jgi:hypothetical protein
MNVLPSTSVIDAPLALAMNSGVPPTDRNALTGEFTPPGMTFFASSKSFFEFFVTGALTRLPPFIYGTPIVSVPLRGVKGPSIGISKGFRPGSKHYYILA